MPTTARERTGSRFETEEEPLARGRDIAIAISVSQPTVAQVRAYLAEKLPSVGKFISCAMPAGPGQRSVAGGEHAAALAEQVSNCVRVAKETDPDAVIHIFAAAPNTLLFYLGQHHQAMAPCVVYEYDFDRRGNKTYQPSFTIC